MHKQIGNAVPWPLAEALGRELENAWCEDERAIDEVEADGMEEVRP